MLRAMSLLALLVGWCERKGHPHAALAEADPTAALAVVCLAALFEPLLNWRGQALLIGLCVISAMLVWRLRPSWLWRAS